MAAGQAARRLRVARTRGPNVFCVLGQGLVPFVFLIWWRPLVLFLIFLGGGG